jgi:alpha-beta hydrolase superfamily lysophospholipase
MTFNPPEPPSPHPHVLPQALPRLRLAARLAGVLALTLATLAGCSALDSQQRKWIFQPSKESWWGAHGGSTGMQDVWIDFPSRVTGQPVRLHGLWRGQERPGAPVLLYLHGARWNVASSAFRMQRMHELGFAVLGIDYRGFGQSTDELPSEHTAYEDARAAWAWLAQQHGSAPRFIFGHSLGGAIAVDLAAQVNDETGLILEGTFTSVPAVVKTMRWGWLPLGPLITQRFDAASRIGRVAAPVLVVHGSQDRLIHPDLGRALYEEARAPKRFVLVEGGSHHNTNSIGQDAYREALRELFRLNI